MPFERPKAPAGYETSIARARAQVRDEVERGVRPGWDDRAVAIWTDLDLKGAFREAQFSKCGYCELKVNDYGVIDHYRPKGETSRLPADRTLWGREVGHSPNIRGRKPEEKCSPGFWWCAHDWDNFVFSCRICNNRKGSLFPVRERPRPTIPTLWEETLNYCDTPLLLNPYQPFNPADHFRFNEFGAIEGRSEEGRETIKTFLLDSQTRVEARTDTAKKAYGLADQVCELLAADTPLRGARVVLELCELGCAPFQSAGMVRAIIEDVLGVSWETLCELVAPDRTWK